MRSRSLLVVPLLLAACAPPLDSRTGTSIDGVTAAATIITSAIGGRCLDDKADATSDGNTIDLYTCNGTAAQSWTHSGSTLVGPAGKCLDIKGNEQVAGTRVQLYTCNGTDAQKWTVSGTSFTSTSGLCLTVAGGANVNGTLIQLDACNGSTSQEWYFGAAPTVPPVVEKSVKTFGAKCDGVTDDTAALTSAFAAAKNDAFTLLVDCPTFFHVGSDITRPIFIDNGTTVTFSSAGKIIVDNSLLPAFVIANSSNIELVDWNVEYTGGIPVAGGATGGQFNDGTLKAWLAKNRGVVFSSGSSMWEGPSNVTAVFDITGPSTNIQVTGMNASVPATSGGDAFIPVLFALGRNWRDDQTVTSTTANTASTCANPSSLTFSNITLDGTYFGWVGEAHDVTWKSITSNRYGDLQDANGANVGGVGRWFAPPHLIYMNDNTGSDPTLLNYNLSISDVQDNGIRVGVARDTSSASESGYAISLKLTCSSCTVTHYNSARPDGFMDVLGATDLTVSNVVASYDSQFLNNIYPGWRWPTTSYSNVTFTDIALTDTAATSTYVPLGNITITTPNQAVTLSNVTITLKKWAGTSSMLPTIKGVTSTAPTESIALEYVVTSTGAVTHATWKNGVETTSD